MPFPGVFSAINTRLQGNMIGKDLRELSDKLPEGIVESQEGYVESQPFVGTQVYVKGKYDLLVRLPDNTYMMIDLKLSSPTEEKVVKYQSQLWSYVYAFEHPAKGEPKQITRAGLLIFYPDTVSFADGVASLTFPPTWLEVPIDRPAFVNFIAEVSGLLEGQRRQRIQTVIGVNIGILETHLRIRKHQIYRFKLKYDIANIIQKYCSKNIGRCRISTSL